MCVCVCRSTLKSNPCSPWQGWGNGLCQSYAIGNFDSWLGYPRRIGLAPSSIRAATRLKGLWWKSRRCLFRQPAASGRSVNASVENLRQTGRFSGWDLGLFPQSNSKLSSSMSKINSDMLYMLGRSRFNLKILTDNTTILEHQNDKQKLQILEALQIRNL